MYRLYENMMLLQIQMMEHGAVIVNGCTDGDNVCNDVASATDDDGSCVTLMVNGVGDNQSL